MVKKYTENLKKDCKKLKVRQTKIELLMNYSKSVEIKKGKNITFFVINN